MTLKYFLIIQKSAGFDQSFQPLALYRLLVFCVFPTPNIMKRGKNLVKMKKSTLLLNNQCKQSLRVNILDQKLHDKTERFHV